MGKTKYSEKDLADIAALKSSNKSQGVANTGTHYSEEDKKAIEALKNKGVAAKESPSTETPQATTEQPPKDYTFGPAPKSIIETAGERKKRELAEKKNSFQATLPNQDNKLLDIVKHDEFGNRKYDTNLGKYIPANKMYDKSALVGQDPLRTPQSQEAIHEITSTIDLIDEKLKARTALAKTKTFAEMKAVDKHENVIDLQNERKRLVGMLTEGTSAMYFADKVNKEMKGKTLMESSSKFNNKESVKTDVLAMMENSVDKPLILLNDKVTKFHSDINTLITANATADAETRIKNNEKIKKLNSGIIPTLIKQKELLSKQQEIIRQNIASYTKEYNKAFEDKNEKKMEYWHKEIKGNEAALLDVWDEKGMPNAKKTDKQAIALIEANASSFSGFRDLIPSNATPKEALEIYYAALVKRMQTNREKINPSTSFFGELGALVGSGFHMSNLKEQYVADRKAINLLAPIVYRNKMSVDFIKDKTQATESSWLPKTLRNVENFAETAIKSAVNMNMPALVGFESQQTKAQNMQGIVDETGLQLGEAVSVADARADMRKWSSADVGQMIGPSLGLLPAFATGAIAEKFLFNSIAGIGRVIGPNMLGKTIMTLGKTGTILETMGKTGKLTNAFGQEVKGIRLFEEANATTKMGKALNYTRRGLIKGTAKAIKGGMTYEFAGQLHPGNAQVKDEAEFWSGFLAQPGTALAQLALKGGRYVMPKVLANMFGKNAGAVMDYIANRIGSGIGETGEETAQTLWQLYRDSGKNYDEFSKQYAQQFGTWNDKLHFFASTMIMGMAMGEGSEAGKQMAEAALNSYRKLDAVDKKTADEVIARADALSWINGKAEQIANVSRMSTKEIRQFVYQAALQEKFLSRSSKTTPQMKVALSEELKAYDAELAKRSKERTIQGFKATLQAPKEEVDLKYQPLIEKAKKELAEAEAEGITQDITDATAALDALETEYGKQVTKAEEWGKLQADKIHTPAPVRKAQKLVDDAQKAEHAKAVQAAAEALETPVSREKKTALVAKAKEITAVSDRLTEIDNKVKELELVAKGENEIAFKQEIDKLEEERAKLKEQSTALYAENETLTQEYENAKVKVDKHGKPFRQIAKRFIGKIIYATPGSGKSFFKKELEGSGQNVVDTDEILLKEMQGNPMVQALAKQLGKEITTVTMGDISYVMHQNGSENRTAIMGIYDEVYNQAKVLANEGATVLTGTAKLQTRADIVFTKHIESEIIKDAQSPTRANPIELAPRVKKLFADEVKRLESTKQEHISIGANEHVGDHLTKEESNNADGSDWQAKWNAKQKALPKFKSEKTYSEGSKMYRRSNSDIDGPLDGFHYVGEVIRTNSATKGVLIKDENGNESWYQMKNTSDWVEADSQNTSTPKVKEQTHTDNVSGIQTTAPFANFVEALPVDERITELLNKKAAFIQSSMDAKKEAGYGSTLTEVQYRAINANYGKQLEHLLETIRLEKRAERAHNAFRNAVRASMKEVSVSAFGGTSKMFEAFFWLADEVAVKLFLKGRALFYSQDEAIKMATERLLEEKAITAGSEFTPEHRKTFTEFLQYRYLEQIADIITKKAMSDKDNTAAKELDLWLNYPEQYLRETDTPLRYNDAASKEAILKLIDKNRSVLLSMADNLRYKYEKQYRISVNAKEGGLGDSGAKKVEKQRTIYRGFFKQIKGNGFEEVERYIYSLSKQDDIQASTLNEATWLTKMKSLQAEAQAEYLKNPKDLQAAMRAVLFEKIQDNKLMGFKMFVSMHNFYRDSHLIPAVGILFKHSKELNKKFIRSNLNQEDRVRELNNKIHSTMHAFTVPGIENDWKKALQSYLMSVRGEFLNRADTPEGKAKNEERWAEIFEKVTGIAQDEWLQFFRDPSTSRDYLRGYRIDKYLKRVEVYQPVIVSLFWKEASGDMDKLINYFTEDKNGRDSNLIQLINISKQEGKMSLNYAGVDGKRKTSFEQSSDLIRSFLDILKPNNFLRDNPIAILQKSIGKPIDFIKFSGMRSASLQRKTDVGKMLDNDLTIAQLIEFALAEEKTGYERDGVPVKTYYHAVGQFGDKDQMYMARVEHHANAKEKYIKYLAEHPTMVPWLAGDKEIKRAFTEYKRVLTLAKGSVGIVGNLITKDGVNDEELMNYVYNYALNKIYMDEVVHGSIKSYMKTDKVTKEKYFDLTDLVKRAGSSNSPGYTVNETIEGGVGWRRIKAAVTMDRKLKTQNLFTVTPTSAPDMIKSKLKASMATKYIGFGTGSTGRYAEQVGSYANTGEYTSDDVVFVSVNGQGKLTPENMVKTIAEVDKAIAAGATILTDSKTYLANSTYNIGEKQLAEHLKTKGISYRENAKNGVTVGIWNSEITTTQDQEVKTETFTHVVMNTASLPKYMEDLSKQLDGVQIMSREWADRLGISMGSLYANLKSDTNEKGVEEKLSSVKAIFSDKDRETGMRGLTKSNVICIEELAAQYPGTVSVQLMEYMREHNIDTLSFEDSTKKTEGEGLMTNAVSTKDDKFFIDKSIKPTIIERRNDHFFIQQDLRHDTSPHTEKQPSQGIANAMSLQNVNTVQKLWNDIQNEFLITFNKDWKAKTDEGKKIWLMGKINEETMHDVYMHLQNGGSINDIRYKGAIRGIIAKEIKREALTRNVNRVALQELPMGLFDDLLEYRKANKDGSREKSGVHSVFEQNPELSKIGDEQQYSKYLDSIFPNSKVKDIVYHGSDIENIEQFNLKHFGQKDDGNHGYGIYLSKNKKIAQGYGEHLYHTIVNITNPYNVKFKDNSPSYLWNRIEKNSYNQEIEKLKQDRTKWIDKVNNGDIGYAFFDKLHKDASKVEQVIYVNNEIDRQIFYKQERLSELNTIKTVDGVINEEYEIVTLPEQIHILGSNKDIEGFKNFIKKNSKPINIYSGDKNGFQGLSNFSNGPVVYAINGIERIFPTVEHAYQTEKALFAGDTGAATVIKRAKTAMEAKQLASHKTGRIKWSQNSPAAWDKISNEKMKEIMRLSFEQNPEKLELLKSTGDAPLTHKTDGIKLGFWEVAFPKILMELRSEFMGNDTDRTMMKFPSVDANIEGVRPESKAFESRKDCYAAIRANIDKYQDMFRIDDEGKFTNEISVGELVQRNGKWYIPGGFVVYARIPADDLHSHTVARLRKRIVNSNFIITDRKSQFIAGADFDGDKRYAETHFMHKEGNKTSIDMREGSKFSKSNRAMNLFIKDYQNPANEEKVTRPIDLDKYNPTADNLRAKWGLKETTKGSSKGGKLNDPIAVMDARNQNNVGNRVISVVAKLSTAYEYSRKIGFTLKKNDLRIPVMSTKESQEQYRDLNDAHKLTGFVKDEWGVIKNHIGIILNLALDNAKDPKIEMMGMNEVTANMFAFALMTNKALDNYTTAEEQEKAVIKFIDNLAAVMNTPLYQMYINYERLKLQVSEEKFVGSTVSQQIHNWAFDNPAGFKGKFKLNVDKFDEDAPAKKWSEDVANLYKWVNGAKNLDAIGGIIDASRETTGDSSEFVFDKELVEEVKTNALELIDTSKIVDKDGVVDPLFEIGVKNIETTADIIFGDDISIQGHGKIIIDRILGHLFKSNWKGELQYNKDKLKEISRTVNEAFILNAMGTRKSVKLIGEQLRFVLGKIGKENNAFVNILNFGDWNSIELNSAYKKATVTPEERTVLMMAFNNLPDMVTLYRNPAKGLTGHEIYTVESHTDGKPNKRLGTIDPKQMLITYVLAMKGNSSSTWSGNFLPYVSNDFFDKINDLLEAKREEWNAGKLSKEEEDNIVSIVTNKHASIATASTATTTFVTKSGVFDKGLQYLDLGAITSTMRTIVQGVKNFLAYNPEGTLTEQAQAYLDNYIEKDITNQYENNVPGVSKTQLHNMTRLKQEYAVAVAHGFTGAFDTYLEDRISKDEMGEPEIHYMTPADAAGEMLASGDPKLNAFVREHLMEMYPGLHIFETKEAFLAFIKAQYGWKGNFDMQSLGAVFKDAMFIDPTRAVQSTFFHEHAHIYWDMLPANHPIKKRMLKRFGGDMEACIIAIGRAGVNLAEDKMNSDKYFGLPQMLKEFWAAVKEALRMQSNEDVAKTFAVKIWNNRESMSMDRFQTDEMRNMLPDEAKQGYDDKRRTFFSSDGTMMSSASRLIAMAQGNQPNMRTIAYNTINSEQKALEKARDSAEYHNKHNTKHKGFKKQVVAVPYTKEQFDAKINAKIQEWDSSSTDGSTVHAVIEMVHNGTPVPLDIADQFAPGVLDQFGNDLAYWEAQNNPDQHTSKSEVKVSDEANMVGGIADRVYDNNGALRIYDFKTSQKSKYDAGGNLSEEYTKSMETGLKKLFQFVNVVKNGVTKRVAVKVSKKFIHDIQLNIYASLFLAVKNPVQGQPTGNRIEKLAVVPILYEFGPDGKISKITIEKNIDVSRTDEKVNFVQNLFNYNVSLHAQTKKLHRHLPALSHSINDSAKQDQDNAVIDLLNYLGLEDSQDEYRATGLMDISVTDIFQIIQLKGDSIESTLESKGISSELQKTMSLQAKIYWLTHKGTFGAEQAPLVMTTEEHKKEYPFATQAEIDTYQQNKAAALGDKTDYSEKTYRQNNGHANEAQVTKYLADQKRLETIYAEIESREVPGHLPVKDAAGNVTQHDILSRLFDMDLDTLRHFEEELRGLDATLTEGILFVMNGLLSAHVIQQSVVFENDPTFNGYKLGTVLLHQLMTGVIHYENLTLGMPFGMNMVADRFLGSRHRLIQYLSSNIRKQNSEVQLDHVEADEMMHLYKECDQSVLTETINGKQYFRNPYSQAIGTTTKEYRFLNFYYQRYINQDKNTRYSLSKDVRADVLSLPVPRGYMTRMEAFLRMNKRAFWYNRLFKPRPYDNIPIVITDGAGLNKVTTFGEYKMAFNFNTSQISDVRDVKKVAKRTYEEQKKEKGTIKRAPSVALSGNSNLNIKFESVKNQDIIASHLNTLSRKHHLETMYPILKFVMGKYQDAQTSLKFIEDFGGKMIFGKSLRDAGQNKWVDYANAVLKALVNLTGLVSLAFNWQAASINFAIGQLSDLVHLGLYDYIIGWQKMTVGSLKDGSFEDAMNLFKKLTLNPKTYHNVKDGLFALMPINKTANIMEKLGIIDVTNEHSYDKTTSSAFKSIFNFLAFGLTEFVEEMNQGVVIASQLGHKFEAFDKDGNLKTASEYIWSNPKVEAMVIRAFNEGVIENTVIHSPIVGNANMIITVGNNDILNPDVREYIPSSVLIAIETAVSKGLMKDYDHLMTGNHNPFFAETVSKHLGAPKRTRVKHVKGPAHFKGFAIVTPQEINVIENISRNIHGDYGVKNAAPISYQPIGQAVMQFKRWIPAMFMSHFARGYVDMNGQEQRGIFITMANTISASVFVAYHNTLGSKERIVEKQNEYNKMELHDKMKGFTRLIKSLEKNPSGATKIMDSMTDSDKNNLRKLRYQFAILVLAMIAKSMAPDDKEKKNLDAWDILKWSLFQRFFGDMMYVVDPRSYYKIALAPAPFLKTVYNISMFVYYAADYEMLKATSPAYVDYMKTKHGADFAEWKKSIYSDAAYKSTGSSDYSSWQKGDAKMWKFLLKIVPFGSGINQTKQLIYKLDTPKKKRK